MLHYEPKDLSVREVHRLLLGGVAPRPIALVSTISKDGILNLSPFSFYNAFGANPPIIAFSPARRGRNGSLKDTYNNLRDTKECVVQAVTIEIVEQVNLASAEFPPEVNEFEKSGLTPIDSDLVKPKRVKESPFQMECVLRDLLSYGEGGSSANIAVCEVIKFHVEEKIFKDGIIHPDLINLVARMSADFYTRASGSSIYEIKKPQNKIAIGFENLPKFLKQSEILTANDLAKLAGVSALPTNDDIDNFADEFNPMNAGTDKISEQEKHKFEREGDYKNMFKAVMGMNKIGADKQWIEKCAKFAIAKDDLDFAWKVLLYSNQQSPH